MSYAFEKWIFRLDRRTVPMQFRSFPNETCRHSVSQVRRGASVQHTSPESDMRATEGVCARFVLFQYITG